MKIHSLNYCDTDSNWNIKKVEFRSLTLLVGASGVGKTQLLQSIIRLRAIAKGISISGIKWTLEFETINGYKYKWIGEYEKTDSPLFSFRNSDDENDDEKDNPRIVYEELWLNGEQIINRDKSDIVFNKQKTVKLSQEKSVLHLLKEEELIAPAFDGFQRIIYSDQVESKRKPKSFNPDFLTKERLLNKYKSLEEIREADESIITKLYLVYHNVPQVINNIKDRFIDIFPFVEDLRITPLDFEDEDNTPVVLREMPFLQIKERNISNWIIQPQISSGMFRTLMHLSELYLCPEGTLILIDEFENSLGVNCIDELTIDLQSASTSTRNLQFIVTSHHPYIINHVHFKNWKIVTRKGSNVTTHEAEEFIDFSKSRQQAFIQLTQLEEFTTGISE